MADLILLRHGESTWNLENRFTGWIDVDLTPTGEEQARNAGLLLQEAGLLPSVLLTSVLKRAIRTGELALNEIDMGWIPVERSWRLNERHYGGLQRLDKAETARLHGDDKVRLWRRSYNVRPPHLAQESPDNPALDARYHSVARELLPLAECLEDVLIRMLPYWYDVIAPKLIAGETVLVSAHGNSLRALAKHLEGIADDKILDLEIPNGEPIVYTFEAGLLLTEKRILT